MAIAAQKRTPVEWLRQGMAAGVKVNTVVLVLGLLLTPTTLTATRGAYLGVAGALLMIAIYGFAPMYGPVALDRLLPLVVHNALIAGLLIGAGFTVQIIGEYLVSLSGDQAGVLGLVTYGVLLLAFIVVAALTAYRSGRVIHGVQAAVWSALIGTFIWVAVVLLALYVFKGTAQGEHVMAYEMYDDFVRSGEADFHAFIMGDMFGAVFFHMLLTPLFAAVCGAAGGALASARGGQRD